MKKYFYIFLSIFVVFLIKATSIPSPVLSYRIPISSSSSTLNTSLISYWKLDEASGTRVDSEPTGTAQNLTDNNTVNQTNGIISSAAWFIAGNTESLSRSDSSDLSVSDIDFSVSAWVNLSSKSSGRAIASHWNSVGSQRAWLIWYDSSADRFSFVVSSNGTAQVNINATSLGSPATNQWYFIVCRHDSSANTISITANNGSVDSVSYGTGVLDSSATFTIGYANFASSYMDGFIDEVGFWKKVLSASEITELYNSGAGKTCCPF